MTQTTGDEFTKMRLTELQTLASSLGIKGVSKYRKSDLIEQITAASGSRGGAPRGGAPRSAEQPREDAAATRGGAQRPAETTTDESPRQPQSDDSRDGESRQPRSRNRRSGDERPEQQRSGERQPRRASAPAGAPSQEDHERAKQELLRELEVAAQRKSENRESGQRDSQRNQGNRDGGQRDGGQRDGDRDQNRDQRNQGGRDGGQQRDGDRDQNRDQRESSNSRRRNRNRNRDRNRDRNDRRGPDHSEPEIHEDDILVPVAGILDVLENYAFVRTSGYLPGPNDVYVTLGQVKKHGLRRGDAVIGAIRQPDENEQGRSSRQKFNALVRLDSVNGMSPEDARRRPEFGKLTPLYPNDMLRLETTPKAITPRVIDLVSPVGKGQRGLIVAPPKAGKTIVMQQIANAIAVNNPEVHLMVVLVDERPEEVTDMQRMVKGEVIASTFDRPASDHTIVAELAVERAKRLVEMGGDVVILLDSLTRLSRAYNLAAPASGRILSGGVDASALYPPKKFFGAARNIEGGGSLTIIASALVETGSKMDEVIFEEFKGTGNLELRLSRQLADKRIFPAVDINASGTRREELLMSPDELKILWRLRRIMGGLEKEAALELVLGKLRETQSNAEFLMSVSRTTPGNKDEQHSELSELSVPSPAAADE